MGTVRTLEVSQDILDSARLTLAELKVELAVYLYAQGRLSIARRANWLACPCGSFANCWPRAALRPITTKLT